MALFDQFMDHVTRMRITKKESMPQVIWKTTTPPFIENSKGRTNVTHFRFLTKQRIRVWNEYTSHAACHHNIPVIDVYNMAAAFPWRPVDHIHHVNEAFEPVAEQLMDYLKKCRKK